MKGSKFLWYINGTAEKRTNCIVRFISEYFQNDFVHDEIDDCFHLHATNRSEQLLKGILDMIPGPFTIVRETNHIDRAYSEGYYFHYSSKHKCHTRFCERLSFFYGRISAGDFIDEKKHANLQKAYVGSVVIHPTSEGKVGRTLIDPSKVNLGYPNLSIRVSEYETDIRGVRMTLQAFPYRMQDVELTTCAEVTLLNLLEYYGHRYDEYRNMYTEELMRILQKNSVERVIPTHGLSYSLMTKALSEVGFSPRLYSGSIYNNLQSILFSYVESGIPVGVGFFEHRSETEFKSAGHSMVCIGHGGMTAEPDKHIGVRGETRDFVYYNAADFCDKYVMMDDNCPPYMLRSLNAGNTESEINILVPLYKRMFMEASDAFAIAENIIVQSKVSIDRMAISSYSNLGTEERPLVLRLFLASSKTYKDSKMKLPKEKYEYIKTVLFDLPLPRFIWICECYERAEFEKTDERMACGEILIDATASSFAPQESVLLIHYPGHIAYRYPDQEWLDVFPMLQSVSISNWHPFPGLERNLHNYA